MSGPSSTSSSEAGEVLRRALRVSGWALGFLVATRILLAIWGPEWTDRTDLAEAAAYLEEARDGNAELVVFGSSRMAAALAPDVWVKLAGGEAGSVLNLSLPSGLFFDAKYLLGSAGGLPARTSHVIVEAPYWNFNRNRLDPYSQQPMEPAEHVRQLGSLADRLAVDDPTSRLQLVAEAIWPIYLRRPLDAWVDHVVSPWRPAPSLPPPSRHWDPANHAGAARDPVFAPGSITRYHFHEAALSRFASRNLAQLLERLEAADVKVTLVQLPARRRYWQTAGAQPGASELFRQVDEWLAERTGSRVSVSSCRLARACGLREQSFTDYGHLKRAGARAYTRWLHQQITAPGPP